MNNSVYSNPSSLSGHLVEKGKDGHYDLFHTIILYFPKYKFQKLIITSLGKYSVDSTGPLFVFRR
jgi:hypothetical protein